LWLLQSLADEWNLNVAGSAFEMVHGISPNQQFGPDVLFINAAPLLFMEQYAIDKTYCYRRIFSDEFLSHFRLTMNGDLFTHSCFSPGFYYAPTN